MKIRPLETEFHAGGRTNRDRQTDGLDEANSHHHHMSVMELGHLLTRSGLTYPEVSSISTMMMAVMRSTIAYPTQQVSSPSRGIPCSHKRGNDDRATAA